jgi:hypothetical protein
MKRTNLEKQLLQKEMLYSVTIQKIRIHNLTNQVACKVKMMEKLKILLKKWEIKVSMDLNVLLYIQKLKKGESQGKH